MISSVFGSGTFSCLKFDMMVKILILVECECECVTTCFCYGAAV